MNQDQKKYQTCREKQSEMDYICTYPQCLYEPEAAIECHACLSKYHKHDLPNYTDHFMKLPDMLEESKKNIETAIKRLKSMYISEKGEKIIDICVQKMEKLITNLQNTIKIKLQDIGGIMVKRLKGVEKLLKESQESFEDLTRNINFQDFDQQKQLAILAISTKENILPNLNDLSVRIDDVQNFLKQIESTINNLNDKAMEIKQDNDQNFSIKPYILKQQPRYQNCKTHNQCLLENICITCNSLENECIKCMKENEKHKDHKLMQVDEYKNHLAATTLSDLEIKKNQEKFKTQWGDFINLQQTEFSKLMSQTINSELEKAFVEIKKRATQDIVHCLDTQENLEKTSQKLQEDLTKDFNSYLQSIASKNSQISVQTIATQKREKRKESLLMKGFQRFNKSDLETAIKIPGDSLFKVSKNQQEFNFEVTQQDFIYDDDKDKLTLGSKDKKNYIQFKLESILYVLDELKINETIIFSEQVSINKQVSTNPIYQIYQWKWFKSEPI